MILSLKGQNKTVAITKEVKNKLKKEKIEKRQLLKEQSQKIYQMIEDWKDVMYQTGMYNSYNKTFTFDRIKYEQYGFSAHLYCPKGLTFKSLDNLRDQIEDGLNCIFIYNKERLDKYMEVRIVTQLSTDKKFVPPKTKPWEMYIGDRFDGTPIIIDLNKWCQVLISGTTGGGKSKLLDCSIATQVYNHNPKDLWLFLIQLDKCDLLLYEDARICKGFANDLDKAIVILEYILSENKRRTNLVAKVKKKGQGSNITDYNKIYKNDQQPTIWVVLDEMASIAEKGSDSPAIKAKKQMVDDLLSAVAQYGRSNNIFLISCLQRATANLLNPFIKSMSNLKISFRQSNSKSSEVAMDDSSIALDLAQRVAVYKLLSYDFLQTPYIDDPLIMSFIEDKLQPNHTTIFNEGVWNKRLDDLRNLGLKAINTSSKESIPKPESTGKQNVSYEQRLKEKEKELKDMENKLQQQTESLEKKINILKRMRLDQHKDTYDKVIDKPNEENIEKIVEENKKKIPGWVEWTPPPQTGKEPIKK